MVTVFFGEDLARYGFGDGHPFGPDRIHAFWAETVKRGLHRRVQIAQPVVCREDDLLRFHDRKHVERVKTQSVSGSGFLDYGDTPAFPGVYEAACFIVGSDLEGLTRIINGDTARVLIPIAGLHHGRRDGAAGFCAFNDCGVLIETLRARFGIRRIAYVDIDAHHGDGVYYAFENDPELIVADIHEDGRFLYPGTGAAEETGQGDAAGTKLNIPMAPGSNDDAFHRVWPQVEAFVRAGRPEIILLQAGADSIRNDPITHMELTPAVHGHVARRLCRLADELCDGRIIAMGGGGYNRTNLACAWNEVLEAMAS